MGKKKPTRKEQNGKVLVDPKVLMAAMAENKPEYQDLVGNPLLLDAGVATIGDGVEIRYDPKSEFITICGKKVPKLELWQVVFSTCDARTREQLLPVRQTEVMHYVKEHNVQLKKDMRKGEILRVRCETSVPLTVVEGLAGMHKKEIQAKSSSGIIIPR